MREAMRAMRRAYGGGGERAGANQLVLNVRNLISFMSLEKTARPLLLRRYQSVWQGRQPDGVRPGAQRQCRPLRNARRQSSTVTCREAETIYLTKVLHQPVGGTLWRSVPPIRSRPSAPSGLHRPSEGESDQFEASFTLTTLQFPVIAT